MRKIFAAITALLILSGSSWADIIYTTSSGNLGMIDTSTYSVEVRHSGFGTSPLVASYWGGSDTKIIVIDRTTDMTESGDSAYIYTSGLGALQTDGVTLEGVYNAQSAVSSWNGRSIFFASRENASIVEFDTNNFKSEHSYQFEPSSQDTYTPYMTGILTSYYGVYGLVDREDAGSSLLMFDGQLKDDVDGFVQVDIDDTAGAMAWLSSSRLAVGESDGVEVFGRYKTTKLVSTDHPVKALCRDNSSGFYYITQEETDGKYVNTLSHYSGGSVSTVGEIMTGETCQLVSDTKNKIVAAIIGENIYIYGMTSDDLRISYDSADLSGVPVSVSNNSASGDDYESARGSCNVSFAGIALLLACTTFLIKK